MKYMVRSTVVVVGMVLGFSISPVQADVESAPICAAVVPCDEKGNVIEPFNSPSPCLAIYEERCRLNYRANELAEAVVQCEDSWTKERDRFKQQIRRLKASARRR